ncbi:MAG TPA: methyltransferase domain-containing protein [Nitrospira sp.]|nr:methyltransferase domain-containing protein [Nitrospira sp.]
MLQVMAINGRWVGTAGLTALLGLGLLWAGPAPAQHGHSGDGIPNVMEYLDRLDRPERDQDQKPAQVIEALELKPGMYVADLGAGSGYFTRRFVEAVGTTGKVYVIDVEAEALKYVEDSLVHMHREFEAEFILARPDNPKIPTESVDVIFVCNTYHHLEDRTVYFHNISSSLKPGGRIAIIDFYHDDRSGELGFPKRHLVAREKVMEEMTGAGYRLAKEHTFLPKQYFLEFAPQ